MTATITPVSQHDGATLTRNVDGEDAYMDGGAAPLGTVLQKLTDRTEFAKDAVAFSRPSWAETLYVASGGTNAVFTVGIGAISGIVTYRSSNTTYTVYAYAGGTIGASKIQGGGNLANSTWYYVYAYDNAGALDFEISTTAPNANLCVKTGDSTRTYLGCFRTLSTGAPIPVRMVRGRYVYDVGGSAYADLEVLSAGASTTFASVPCSGLVPPHGRVAVLNVNGTLPVGGPAITSSVEVQSYGSAAAAAHVLFCGAAPATYSMSWTIDVVVDSSQRAQYKVVGGANAPTATVYVHGFCE